MKEKCNKECEYINKILSTSGAYISFLDTRQDIARVLLGRIGGTIMSLPKKRLPRPQNISGLKNILGSSVLCSLQLFARVMRKMPCLQEHLTNTATAVRH